MNEKAVAFGPTNGLIGIISDPDTNRIHSAPGVIILNAGLLHRVGPFRQTVHLARTLAANGFFALRFDLSGIGDSRMHITNRSCKEMAAVKDIQAAMDFLSQRYQIEKFVLMGLCSGADNSHRAAVADQRIVGTVHFDGLNFRNSKYYLNHYGRRLLSSRWIRTKLSNLLKLHDPQAANQVQIDIVDRAFPPAKQVSAELKDLISRGVHMLFIYTSGVADYNNYKNQLRDTFRSIDFQNQLELEFYPYADHTYSRVNNQKKLIKRVAHWMDQQFGILPS